MLCFVFYLFYDDVHLGACVCFIILMFLHSSVMLDFCVSDDGLLFTFQGRYISNSMQSQLSQFKMLAKLPKARHVSEYGRAVKIPDPESSLLLPWPPSAPSVVLLPVYPCPPPHRSLLPPSCRPPSAPPPGSLPAAAVTQGPAIQATMYIPICKRLVVNPRPCCPLWAAGHFVSK